MVTKLGMYSASGESVTVPVGRDRIMQTALRTNQISQFVDVFPQEKKMSNYYSVLATTSRLISVKFNRN